MKNISFMYSASKSNVPSTGILLDDGTVATIDKEIVAENEFATENAKKVIANTTLEDIIWWWPSGHAFSEIYGVSEFAVINMLADFGFTVSKSTRLKHTQVEDDTDPRYCYLELKLSVTDEHYKKLCSEYGNIKVVQLDATPLEK